MTFLARKKKAFIRWYYGSWVNDPQAEVPMFGAVISYDALRLHAVVRWFRRNQLRIALALVAVVALLVLAF